ncbi:MULTISPECIES: amino acid adenylation domain-containing protein [Flavobacteriaceae]|uniref:amino acid adenylation domain-containing protein n=1 Tax=Flavobacteriaceae TaxID=49546 RepID=UPI0039EBF23F
MNLELSGNGYEFSENQKNLWLIGKKNLNTFFNEVILQFPDKVKSDVLMNSLRKLLKENEVLRARVLNHENYKYPLQKIEDVKLEVYESADSGYNRAYHPESDSPIRFKVVKKDNLIDELHVKIYSLWSDSFSIVSFTNQLLSFLENKEEDKESIEYTKFCAWQNELLKEEDEEAKLFWNNKKYNFNQKTYPFINKKNGDFAVEKIKLVEISGSKYDDLKGLAEKYNSSIEDFLFYKWSEYLRLFKKQELIIGYIPFYRNYDELKNTLGYVNKTIPVTFLKNEGETQSESIESLISEVTEIREWSDYFTLNREVNSNDSKTRIFKYCFEYIEFTKSKKLVVKDFSSIQDPFDLKLGCIDYGDRVELELYFNIGEINENDCEVIVSQTKGYFQGFDKELAITDVENKIINKVNNTNKELVVGGNVIDLIEERAEEYPNDVALIVEGKNISYKELKEKVNKLVNYLINKKDVTSGKGIAILMKPSEWSIISALAVLKAGAYYIPIDESYPKDRVNYILKDLQCELLISSDEAVDKFELENIDILIPNKIQDYDNISACPINVIKQDGIAYCIYTSGSTGKPKGCLVSHKNLYNYINWVNEFYFPNDDLGNFGFLTSMSFDLTVTSIFSPLTRGKKITIFNEESIVNTIKKAFTDSNIDSLKLTPAHLILLNELNLESTPIQKIICGGEQLKPNHRKIVKKISNSIHLYNEYGPTETTVGCVAKKIDLESKEEILIGKPIANTRVAILNEEGEKCPIGVSGEILISGKGVALGYLNNEELTSEKFIKSDFLEERSYKSGDIGRWLSNGEIEYIGRIDNQVKVKGYRIELQEIENLLNKKEKINEAIVLVKQDNDLEKEIIAFIKTDEELSENELRDFLENSLPEYMIPNLFIKVENFPLTINGKIDTIKLLSTTSENVITSSMYVAPSDEIEEKLVEIWENILKREKIGVEDDFFSIGGDSIKAVRIVSEIQQQFNTKVDLIVLFQEPTIKGLAEMVKNDLWHEAEENQSEIVDKTVI